MWVTLLGSMRMLRPLMRCFPLMVPRWLSLPRRWGHVFLAEHRLHHWWTWTWPANAYLPVLLQVPGTHDPPFKTSGRFQMFVKGLAGHTLVNAGCSGDMLVDDFMELVSMRDCVAVACFYLVGAGSKALRLETTLSDAWVVGHLLLFMVGRPRRGSSRPRPPPVPGSWHCYVCDMGGCWPARNSCFRCLAPRRTVPQSQKSLEASA